MIIVNTSNEELVKSVQEDRERLQKEAEDALEANKKEAEEIEKYHGEDTKKPIKNKVLKAMHLSESLFEDLDENDYFDFVHSLYRSVRDVCMAYRMKSGRLSFGDVRQALEEVSDRMYDDSDLLDLLDESYDYSNSSLDESLDEDLSQAGKRIVSELKQELGPELQKKVVALMKDLQSSLTKEANEVIDDKKNDSEDEKKTNESLNESSKWSVYYSDDEPSGGTIFDDEDSAKKFQEEMGEDWEVVQLPDTKWDTLSDGGLFDESLKEDFDWDFQSEEESKIQKALKRKLNTIVNVSVSTNDDDNDVEVWVEPYPEDEDVCIKVLEKFGYSFVKDCGAGSNNGTKELLFKGTRV